MEQELLRRFEGMCVQEEAPACQSMCPLHVDARTFIRFMKEGKKDKARQILDKSMPLSSLTGFLCEGDCISACRRAEIDKGVNVPILERACVLNTKASKAMSFPSTGKSFAVLGGGLSSFILAHELGKKGHKVFIYHVSELGNDIKAKKGNTLPENALLDAIKVLEFLKVQFIEIKEYNKELFELLLEENRAVYLSLDDSDVSSSTSIKEYFKELLTVSPLTLVSENKKILVGGSENLSSCIQSIADGKKAALSIERIMQGVDPATAREKEASYETKLYTNLEGYEKIESATFENENTPTLDEANEEAKRCIDCSCMECVKQCSYLKEYKNYPKRYLREVYNNLAVVQGFRQANGMINACTQCGLCEKICPKGLNMGKYLAVAREEMVDSKRMPPSAHEFALDDMVFSNSEIIQFVKKENSKENQNNKYIFFPGCQLPTILPEQVQSAYTYLTENLEGGVGFHLACCGMPAQWAAQTKYLTKITEEFKSKWIELDKPTYIFACASCSEFFHKHCPEIKQVSLWEVIRDCAIPSQNVSLSEQKLAIHDPCSSRDFPQMQESVRSLLRSIGQDYEELQYSKELTRCCGYGGLSSYAKPNIADTFLYTREKESDNTLLVYCAICRERYQKINKDSVHILELLFPIFNVSTKEEVIKSIKEASKKQQLSLMERQEKRYDFRSSVLEKFWGETSDPMLETSITLNISDDVKNIIGLRHILTEDIITVILKTKEENSAFYNAQTDRYLAAYRPRLVTYWVEYKEEVDGSFTIYNAYCHRMVVPGITSENQPTQFEQACCK